MSTDGTGRSGTGDASSSVEAYVGIGANLGDPVATFRAVRAALAVTPGVLALAASPCYETRPVGPAQPMFRNAVLRLVTELAPLALLDRLLDLELRFGRVRDERWGPRTIDLDLLLYGDETVRHPRLSVPHPELVRRGFVLVPLADLASELVVPVDGRTVAALLAAWRAATGAPDEAVRRAPDDPEWTVSRRGG